MLCAPSLYIRQILFIKRDKIAQSTGFYPDGILQDSFAFGVFQGISNRSGSRCNKRSLYGHFKSENTIFVFLFVQRCIQFVVGNVLFGSAVKIHIAFDTTQTPHILTFQISTRTPSVHFQSNHIFAFIEDVSNIPFGSCL